MNEQSVNKTAADAEISLGAPQPAVKKSRKLTATQLIVYSALLSAIGLMIPMYMPTIVVVPDIMTFTLASHVPVMVAMFISPFAVIAVTLTTALGFWFKTGLIVVVVRALTHIFFAIAGFYLARFFMNKMWKVFLLNGILALIHAAAETLSVGVYKLIYNELFSNDKIVFYLAVSVFTVTFLHSVMDFFIAYLVYIPLKKNKLLV